METARGISNMVVNAILPCLTFNKIVTSISWKDIKEIGVIVLSAILLFSIGGACSMITNYTTPVPKKWFWGLLFAGIFPNISDLPIAYLQSMGNGTIFTEEQSEKGVAFCCIFLFTQSFLMMNFGMWRIVGLDFTERGKKKDNDIEKGTSTPTTHKTDFEKVHDDLNNDAKIDTPNNVKVGKSSHMEYDRMTGSLANSLSDQVSEEALSEVSTDEVLSDDDGNTEGHTNNYYVQKYFSDDDSSGGEKIPGMPNAYLRNVRNGDSGSNSNSYKVSKIISSPSILETIGIREVPYKSRHYTTRNLNNRSSNKNLRRRRRRLTMDDMIAEYSAVDKMKQGDLDLSRPLSLIEDIGETNTSIGLVGGRHLDDEADDENYGRVITSHSDNGNIETHPSKYETFKRNFNEFIKKHNLGWVTYFLINCFRPASLGALLGIICALIPWLKALFVHTYVHVHQAPDGEPVLNFLMDFTSYIGNACIPLGLLMLGGTLARLKITTLPKGFIRSAILMTLFRLVVIPIIGVAWANKLYDINWLETDISKFAVILTFAMPNATAQVYFTAFYTPTDGSHLQLDCLSVFFLIQYMILFITLSIVLTYTLKVDLKV
ncbi:uncharacterized protein NDAI_0J00720 [Naumovozyma dairenensis CBS 421]|uniref:Uncharacterized protein n=1 Tax=Naumovozyma dairenensis (strain ATCC 10597 / BCRC 20456 / CBS 421 / NBRC 0211 / NRRL Y-12639) TaxID=1071378 RepID=G0WGN6_NAUDC|nr:hypothetical protein NDAI_0J00720 [Naumovozyma dairenensis CBS 421]CCD26964.1 hypothetical protein NDAI_0J00720 [Naumovozyma dairenensis CBS 421]